MSLTESSRAQISMEFLSYFTFLLLMFAVFGPLFFNQSVRVRKMQTRLKADRVATTVEKEINAAIRFGGGYSRNFTIPGKIGGGNYTVGVHSDVRLLEISWRGGKETRQIMGSSFQGNLKPGRNRIRNIGGKIKFN